MSRKFNLKRHYNKKRQNQTAIFYCDGQIKQLVQVHQIGRHQFSHGRQAPVLDPESAQVHQTWEQAQWHKSTKSGHESDFKNLFVQSFTKYKETWTCLSMNITEIQSNCKNKCWGMKSLKTLN